MPRRFVKHRLLLDEGFHLPDRLPILNRRFDLKHVAADHKQSGISDEQVYILAAREHRLLVTYNVKDFQRLAGKSQQTGVIGVSTNLPLEQIDKKLTALLMRSGPNILYGKLTTISGEGVTP